MTTGVDVLTGKEIQTGVFFVNEYLANQGYGGPEEGGWWYPSGEFIQCHGVYLTEEVAMARRDSMGDYLTEQREGQYQPSSVLCNGYTVLKIDAGPGADYPTYRPHYE